MSEQKSWVVIVLSYNEEKTIQRVINELISIFEKTTIDYDIVIIDDGSTDNTKSVLQNYNEYNKIRVISHDRNLGIGYSLVEGYKLGKNNIIGMVPGDGQFEIALLKEAIRLFGEDDELKLVSFYRDLNNVYSTFRKLVTKIQKTINLFVLGVKFKDVNWVKFLRMDILGNKDFCMKSSLIETEIMYIVTLKKYKFIELPSNYLSREVPRSRLSFIKSLLLASKDVFNLFKLKRYYKKLHKQY